MPTPLVAVRMPKDLIERLREEAARETARQGESVSWVGVLRRAAERYLAAAKRRR